MCGFSPQISLPNEKQDNLKQECISVGCVLTTAVAATRSQYQRVGRQTFLEADPTGSRHNLQPGADTHLEGT